MLVVPYNTDAPIYYRPWGTGALILANVFVFTLCVANPELATRWMLPYGAGLTPANWVTSNFIHGGVLHLVPNMLFLWGFGLVIEGKLGWQRFLPLFLTIGVIECAIEQGLNLSGEGGSYGASSIIFGLMVMALLWAPMNELSVACWFMMRLHLTEISIRWFAGLTLLWSILFAMLSRSLSADVLHLLGALVGGAIGLVMLWRGWVDCEGWDLISVMRGTVPSTVETRRRSTAKRQRPVAGPKPPTVAPQVRFAELMSQRKPGAALLEFQKVRQQQPDWNPGPEVLLALARGLRKLKQWQPAVDCYADYIRLIPADASARLELAEIFARVQQRPAAARRVLKQCDRRRLIPAESQRLTALESRIQFLLDSGIIEVEVPTL